MARCIDAEAAANRIYNCSGKRGHPGADPLGGTACGRDPDTVELRSFDPWS